MAFELCYLHSFLVHFGSLVSDLKRKKVVSVITVGKLYYRQFKNKTSNCDYLYTNIVIAGGYYILWIQLLNVVLDNKIIIDF